MSAMVAAGHNPAARHRAHGRVPESGERGMTSHDIEITDREACILVLHTPSGDRVEASYNLGPIGQLELRINNIAGREAIWILGDLISGGEEADGYYDGDEEKVD